MHPAHKEENQINKPVTTREYTSGSVGHLEMVVEDYTLCTITPDDYKGSGISDDLMERAGGVIGSKIMQRFNSLPVMERMLEALKSFGTLPERQDIFQLKEHEVVMKDIEPRLTKKVGKFLLTAIHSKLKDGAQFADFLGALSHRIDKVREEETNAARVKAELAEHENGKS